MAGLAVTSLTAVQRFSAVRAVADTMTLRADSTPRQSSRLDSPGSVATSTAIRRALSASRSGTRLNLPDAHGAPAFIGDRRRCKSLFHSPVEKLEKLFSHGGGIAVALSAMIGNAALMLVQGFEGKIGGARRLEVGRESGCGESCDSGAAH
jgi:hypothetical protein